MYKLLNIVRNSEFMDSNVLQCDTLVAVLLLVEVAQLWPVDQNAQQEKCDIFLHYTSEAVFCSNMDAKVI